MPTDASDGFVLTSDPVGSASWQPAGLSLPYSGSVSSAHLVPAFTVTNTYSSGPGGGAIQGVAQGDGVGVYGLGVGEGGGTGIGVYGKADGDGMMGWGVVGRSDVVGGGVGVYGFGSMLAGSFDGDVDVLGTLWKGGGGFKIDHPLDPENQHLYHSFVESPDMMNVYNGNVVLDDAGEALVELPDWFEALNRDFRYQLTCIGGFAPIYIAEKISGNAFTIAGGEPGMEVSWQVTGVRQDAFAENHRIPVEEDKPDDQRGKYLHPEDHGKPETLGVGYETRRRLSEMSGSWRDE